MPRQVAFLRGINLGPHRRVSMPELRELLEGHGHGDVRTHLQSGNVVLTSRKSPALLAKELERQIAAGLGVEAVVLVRTLVELAAVVDRDPLGAVATDPSRYLVTFLAAKPQAAVVERLERLAAKGECVAAGGRELYTWHPDGVGRSKLAKALSDAKLGGTARNWRTVTALLEL